MKNHYIIRSRSLFLEDSYIKLYRNIYKNARGLSLFGLCLFLCNQSAFASESLSYSGRLVNTNGSPVTGSVDLKVELAYSSTPTNVKCSQDFLAVPLTNGVFHLKVDFDCTPNSLTDVLAAIPNGQAASIRVTDVTHSKVYSYQALHAVPFSNISDYAKQLVLQGTSNGQVLTWNNVGKKWEVGAVPTGGTVTNVSVSAPLTISNPATTPSITIPQANTTTDGYLSNTDWNTFNNKQPLITAGTTAQYYRGDKSWQTLDTSAVAENIANLYFTNARVLGVPLTGFSVGAGAITAADTVLSALEKTQGQINSVNSASAHFLVKDNTDSITGAVNVGVTGALTITNAPALPTDAANKQYVDSKLALTGGTLSGVLTLDSDLKIKGGSNYVTVRGHATSDAYNFILPSSAGTSGQFLQTDGSGNLSWVAQSSTATPSGAAGGDLSGTYPNPTITGLSAAKISAGNVSNTEFDYLDGVTSAIQTQLNGKQATNSNLSALSSYNTNGILVQTAANTFAGRSVVGTTNRVSVTNGNGVSGDPTIDIATGLLPSPIAGDAGKFLKASGANTSAWTALSSSDVTTALTFTPVNKAGDSMTGDLSLGTSKLRFKDSAANYAELKAPTTVTTTYALTLPADKAASNGQVLTGDTSGNLTWTTPSSTATPSGAAGGDLSGTYPNPTITGLSAAKVSTGVVDNIEFNYLDGVTSAIQTQLNGKQASDTTLTSFAAYNTNGFLVQTAADTFTGRSIVGTANRVSITNGNGVAGNPTIDITTALLPSPLAGDAGKILKASGADTSAWTALSASDITTALTFTPVNKAGDSMTGDLALNTKLRLKDSAANYVELKAPATVTTTYTLTFPAAKASVAGQMLTSDTAGVLSWTTPATTATPTGAAGGDLSGTYPNPTITALDAAKINTGVISNAEFNYLDGVTSSIQTQLNGKQAVDTTLTSLAAYNTNGILVQTAADTFVGRSIAGTANRLTVTNGDGVAGNPTLNIPTALLPSPVAGDAGKFLKASGADTSAWTMLSSSDITTALGFTPINKAGDTMATGTFTYNGTALLRTLDPIGPTDVATKQYVDGYGQWTKGAGANAGDVYRLTGNVGIGTTNPTAPLNVTTGIGTVAKLESSNVNYTNLQLYNNSNSKGWNFLSVGSTPTSYGTSGSFTIDEIGGGSRMTIVPGGNVGIGSTNPSNILHLSNAAGEEGTPGLFIQDPTTTAAYGGQLYYEDRSGANALKLSVLENGTESGYLAIDRTSGKIGIGTTAPKETLDIKSGHIFHTGGDLLHYFNAYYDSAVPAHKYAGYSGGSKYAGGVGFNPTTGMLYFSNTATAGASGVSAAISEKMVINNNGNVGIGTTSPAARLDVTGTTNAAMTSLTQSLPNSGVLISSDITNTYHNSGMFWRSPNNNPTKPKAGIWMYNEDGPGSWLLFGTSNSYATGITNTALAIAPTGNIGIGTTAPAGSLHIVTAAAQSNSPGAGIFLGKSAGNDYQIQLTNSAGGIPHIDLSRGTNTDFDARISAPANNMLTLGTSTNSSVMNIVGNLVGIGTAAPGARLDVRDSMVVSSSSFPAINLSNESKPNGTSQKWALYNMSAPSYSNGLEFWAYDTPGCAGGLCQPNFKMYDDGNAWVRGTLTQASDKRLKKNIVPLNSSLEKILALDGVYYNWISPAQDQDRQIGLIAQNVKKVFPEVVKKNSDGFLSVNYISLVAPIIESVKELYAKVVGQDKAIHENRRAIASLKEETQDEIQKKDQEIKELKNQNEMMKKYLCAKDPKAPFCLSK